MDPLWQIWTWNPLKLWVTDIRLKETDSEASRCRNINFYRKKHRCFQVTATLSYVFFKDLIFLVYIYLHQKTLMREKFLLN